MGTPSQDYLEIETNVNKKLLSNLQFISEDNFVCSCLQEEVTSAAESLGFDVLKAKEVDGLWCSEGDHFDLT